MSDQRTALVLGGGGITGIAWEIGVLAGLAEAGVDLTGAGLVVGTSAGSVVGAQLTSGAPLEEMYARQLEPPTQERVARMTRGNLIRYGWAMVASRGRDVEFRRRIGTLAVAAEQAGLTPSEQERLEVIGSRLVSREWPEREFLVTAVDAATGEFRTFGRDSGVPMVHAVAASCAVPGVYPPVTIDGRRYVDGGMRSAANADLAQGYDRLVVLAPIPRGVGPLASVDAQVTGMVSRVAVVAPDEAARAAIGRNVLDPAARAPAARAGRAQAASVVARVREAWAG
ncbi:patatin-like phospholipase family protein [Blastococcus sp. MG754426]|uniref:patatin-like phospholipase family protein n=1 Tax=unclassified Blastococcus TaxID=2619396 RepID=UPI001EEFD7F3|nr:MULTISPECIES: patatin-like phospholipase family protein [unclassified Blastococcus]MCF6508248.1 patatin-like phospholipase family protein [Blastococcus sp. MG754426]MCF6512125.1 patatin-like phospholipase family protein [Blastococcus sp. MG754427]MCF6734549.1 patatin-like phospholipase family protein [Blastococcus sp. KM273129]